MIRYSLKQMLRSRLKTCLFFFLLTGSACLLSLGINLWDMNNRAIEDFEDVFTTIGIVQQKQQDLGLVQVWNEYFEKYNYIQDYEYGRIIKDTELMFEGAEYLIKPRQRPYFGADMGFMEKFPSYDGLMEQYYFTIEFIPLEDYDGTKPVELEIVKSYAESYQEGQTISFFHYEDLKLEVGKRYIASLSNYMDVNEDTKKEFCLHRGLRVSQYDTDGNKLHGKYDDVMISEVTDNFFDTELGKTWLEQAKAVQKYQDILPVTPVDDIQTVMAFYEQRAYIEEGRTISQEEYENGSSVCMVPKYLANQLRLRVGDTLRLPLLYASYGETAVMNFSLNGGGFGWIPLNAEGKMYDIFDDQEYEIVGIYDITSNPSGDYALSEIEVFIPINAVKGSWDNHINSFGPMRAANTTFEIENGATEEFLAKWNEQEFSEELEVTFYDKGYSEFERGIQSRKMMSNIFLISGLLLTVIILIFFCNLFIMGQKQRISVERVLGLTKRECIISVLVGLLLVAVTAIVLGSCFGWILTEYVSGKVNGTLFYDTLYSITKVRFMENYSYAIIGGNIWTVVITVGVLVVLTLAIAGMYLKMILIDTPLQMLGKIED